MATLSTSLTMECLPLYTTNQNELNTKELPASSEAYPELSHSTPISPPEARTICPSGPSPRRAVRLNRPPSAPQCQYPGQPRPGAMAVTLRVRRRRQWDSGPPRALVSGTASQRRPHAVCPGDCRDATRPIWETAASRTGGGWVECSAAVKRDGRAGGVNVC